MTADNMRQFQEVQRKLVQRFQLMVVEKYPGLRHLEFWTPG